MIISQTRKGLALAALLLVGCGQMAIDGTVVDAAGRPLEGATVTILGTQCQALTAADGGFSVPCTPGVYDVTVSQVGHVAETVSGFDASERKRYDLGRQALVPIPEMKGLLQYAGGEYVALKPGYLRRIHGGSGTAQYKWYCLDRKRTQEVNALSSGTQTFFDHASVGWRAFRLDGDGCAYRMSPVSGARWRPDYEETAEVRTSRLAPEFERVEMALEPGEYFVADWERGFFTKASGEKGDDAAYSGYYLQVR